MSEVIDVRGRHLLRLADFTSAEILYLLDLAAELKAAKRWPRSEIVDLARSIANETGAKITMTEVPSEAVEGCDVLLTDVWVSMGEPDEVWAERIKLLSPYQVNSAAMAATGNPDVKFLHCLPAFHNADTPVGREIADKFGMDALEVTEDVFESSASLCSTRQRTVCTRSRRSWSLHWPVDDARGRRAWRKRTASTRRAVDRGKPTEECPGGMQVSSAPRA